MLSHNNIVWNAMNVIGEDQTGARHSRHSGPMFHLADGAQNFGVTACGGRHVVVPRFDVD
jgi:long-chain acyl-CoA synthetase